APLTVTANNATRFYGQPNPAFTALYSGFVNGDTEAVLAGSPALTTTATAASPPGSYPITASAGTLRASNYSFNFVGRTLNVSPAPLSASGVAVSAFTGAPFIGTVATFANADPFGGAGSYAATINWGDGSVSAGVVTPDGAGGFLVTGSNTYGAPGSYPVSVQVSHNLG